MQKTISSREQSLDRIYHPHELITLPERFLEIRNFLMRKGGDANALAHIIETDIATSATLLKIANSSTYNPMGQSLGTLPKAIARLGLAISAQVAMSMTLLQGSKSSLGLQHIREFWTHSFAVSQLCLRMSLIFKKNIQESLNDMFMAGLFHDIGRMILSLHVDSTYFEQPFAELHGAELCTQEHIAYGIDHTEAGKIILTQWRMPQGIIDAVANHHHPAQHLAANLCSYADQFVYTRWHHSQSIDAVQCNIHALSHAEMYDFLACSDVLRPLLQKL